MPYSPPSLSEFNASPPSDDGSQVESNSLQWARDIVAKIGAPLKTFAEAINTAVKNQFDVTPDYSRTQAEIDANVVPINTKIKPGHVLRYGAVGDGVASDHQAVIDCLKANNAAHFPGGLTYGLTSQIATTITGDITITGDNAKLKVLAGLDATLDSEGMIRLTVTGNTGNNKIFVNGIDFDCSDLATHCLTILNTDATTADANLMTVEIGSRCSFRNCKEEVSGTGANACSINGWFQKVIFGGQVYDITSADPAAPVGVNGLFVGLGEGVNANSFTRTTVIAGSAVFSNIQTLPNINANGIFIAAADQERATLIVQSGAYFHNCKTRSIKSQCRHNSVIGATFFRDDFGVNANSSEIDFQRAGGSVIGCDFYYDGTEAQTMITASMRLDTDSKLVCLGNHVFITNVATPTISKFFQTFADNGTTDFTADKVIINDNTVRGKLFRFGTVDCSGATTQNSVVINNNRVDHIEDTRFVHFRRSSAGNAYYKANLENNWQKTATGATIYNIDSSNTKVTPYIRNNHNLPLPPAVNIILPSVDAVLQFEKGDFYPNPVASIGDISGWTITTAGKPGTWTPHGQVGLKDNAGTPVSVVTPDFVGQMVRDTGATPDDVYIAVGTANTDWEKITP